MYKGERGNVGWEVFLLEQKTAYDILSGLVGSEMCIEDRPIEIGPKAQGFSIYERNGRKRLTLTGGHEEQFQNIRKCYYK